MKTIIREGEFEELSLIEEVENEEGEIKIKEEKHAIRKLKREKDGSPGYDGIASEMVMHLGGKIEEG